MPPTPGFVDAIYEVNCLDAFYGINCLAASYGIPCLDAFTMIICIDASYGIRCPEAITGASSPVYTDTHRQHQQTTPPYGVKQPTLAFIRSSASAAPPPASPSRCNKRTATQLQTRTENEEGTTTTNNQGPSEKAYRQVQRQKHVLTNATAQSTAKKNIQNLVVASVGNKMVILPNHQRQIGLSTFVGVLDVQPQTVRNGAGTGPIRNGVSRGSVLGFHLLRGYQIGKPRQADYRQASGRFGFSYITKKCIPE